MEVNAVNSDHREQVSVEIGERQKINEDVDRVDRVVMLFFFILILVTILQIYLIYLKFYFHG